MEGRTRRCLAGADLILDEGDQRGDDHREAIADDCGQLVAQALACHHSVRQCMTCAGPPSPGMAGMAQESSR